MKWTVKLVSEITPGQQQEYDLVELERTNPMTPANLGLAISDGKTLEIGPFSEELKAGEGSP